MCLICPLFYYLSGWGKVEQSQYEDFNKFLGPKTQGMTQLETWESFYQFRLANTIYKQLKSSDVAEQASRMMAMETASTNAEDMDGFLTYISRIV